MRCCARLEREKQTLSFPDRDTDLVGYLATAYSHPAWLVARWLARFGAEETEALLQIDNTAPPVTLRVNRRWVTRDGLQTILTMHGLETQPTPISATGLFYLSGGNPRELEEYGRGIVQRAG